MTQGGDRSFWPCCASRGRRWAQDTTITIRPRAARVGQRGSRAPAAARRGGRRHPALQRRDAPSGFTGSTRIPAAPRRRRRRRGARRTRGGRRAASAARSWSSTATSTFEPGAVVGGDVLVVGGTIAGRGPREHRGRDPRVPRSAALPARTATSWCTRRSAGSSRRAGSSSYGWGERPGQPGRHRCWRSAGTYNRVEGLPILFGPRADLRVADDARLQADATAIFRTQRHLAQQQRHRLPGARRAGAGHAATATSASALRGYDVVAPVESWPLKDFEVGWASFLFHRDYRDYYRRHGGSLYATLRLSRRAVVHGRGSRRARVLARRRAPRGRCSGPTRPGGPTPRITDGKYRCAVGLVPARHAQRPRHAERRAGSSPASTRLAHGGDVTGDLGPRTASPRPCVDPALADGNLDFQRIGFDARRYLRLSPSGRLNLRLAGGGWVGGEPAAAAAAPGAGLPRSAAGLRLPPVLVRRERAARATRRCATARCVAQAEFRTHLGFDFGPEVGERLGRRRRRALRAVPRERPRPGRVRRRGPRLVGRAQRRRGPRRDPGRQAAGAQHVPDRHRASGSTSARWASTWPSRSTRPTRAVTFTVRMGRRF